MIKARLSNNAVLFGLSAQNVARLKEGKPIKFDGRPLGLPGDVIIVYGETEEAIAKEIIEATAPRATPKTSEFCRACGASIPHREGEGRCVECIEHLPCKYCKGTGEYLNDPLGCICGKRTATPH